MAHGHYIQIRGERWRLVLGRPPANLCDGYCDSSTRTIYIRKRKDVDLRSTAIHEVLHACFPDIEESAIEEAEVAINGVLGMI